MRAARRQFAAGRADLDQPRPDLALKGTGVIDVAMLQTLARREDIADVTASYGLVIVDECHRSIYGSWQTALTHFDALQLGLTATPVRTDGRGLGEAFDELVQGPDRKSVV